QPSLGLLAMAFGTGTIFAGVITVEFLATVITLPNVPSTGWGPAAQQVLDHPAFGGRNRMCFLVISPMESENIRDLDHNPSQALEWIEQMIDGVPGRLLGLRRQVRVNGGRAWTFVPEQKL